MQMHQRQADSEEIGLLTVEADEDKVCTDEGQDNYKQPSMLSQPPPASNISTVNVKVLSLLIIATIIAHGLISYYFDFHHGTRSVEISKVLSPLSLPSQNHEALHNVIYGHLHFPSKN